MEIKGLQKTTLIDYPGKVACIVFLPKCNFNCGYCFNRQLVKEPEKIPSIPEKEFFEFLEKRKKWLDAVVITGGEPTLHKELPEFISRIKKMGFLIKLDTNGSNPALLKQLLEEKLLDFVAMDIKSSPEKYEKATNCKVEMQKIKKSAELIMKLAPAYEFRSTILPRHFSKGDAITVGKWLNGAEKIALQQFRAEADLMDKEFANEEKYSEKELHEIAKTMERFFKKVEIRV